MLDLERIKTEREALGLSMAAAARKVGMIPQAWERIERGDREKEKGKGKGKGSKPKEGASLTLATLNRLAKALEVDARELLKPVKP